MVTLINLHLVFFHVKQAVECKNDTFITIIIFMMHIEVAKSYQMDIFMNNIIFINAIKPVQNSKKHFMIYFWCVSHRFYGIIKQTHCYIQNQCVYPYWCRITFAVSNTYWIESVQTSLLMNNDISTFFVDQKETFLANKCNKTNLLCGQICEERLIGVLWLISIGSMVFLMILIYTMCFSCRKLLVEHYMFKNHCGPGKRVY
eukprot:207254_1